jgi:hypothetical protein
MVRAQMTARDSEGSERVWWKFMRNEGSIGDTARWLVSWATSSEGNSYGSKMSEMVVVTEAGSVTVCA